MLFLFLLAGSIYGCLPVTKPETPPAASPAVAASPTAGQPDLVITNITLESDSSDPCEQSKDHLFVSVRVHNQGEADSGAFIVSINNTWQNVSAGLNAGQSLTLWFSGYQEEITVQIDPSSQVMESREGNNLVTQHFALGTLPATT